MNLDAALARDAEAGVPLDGSTAATCDVRTNCLPADYCHSALCVSGLCVRDARPDGTICNANGTSACFAGACVPIATVDAGVPTGEVCEVGVNCFAINPCQPALCVANQCASRFLPDGAACGSSSGFACKAGYCVTASCGDGIQAFGAFPAGERCDDANGVNGDGCDVTCTPEVVHIDVDPADSAESVGTSTAQNIGVDGANRAIVVYRRRYSSGVESVLAQRLGPWGAPIDTTPIVIDESIGLVPTSGDPTVIGLPSGWVVAWASGARTGSFDVYFRIVAANGTMSDVRTANRSTLGTQWDPELVAITSGFVVGWSDENGSPDDYGSGVVARVFDANGVELSGDIRLATDRSGHEGQLALAAIDNRWFAAWQTSSAATGLQPEVRARAFDGVMPASATETKVPVAPIDTIDVVPLRPTQTFGFSARALTRDAYGDLVIGQFRADGAFIVVSDADATSQREGRASATVGPANAPAVAFELDARGRSELYVDLSTVFTDLTWSLRYRMRTRAVGNVSVVGDKLGYWVGFQEDVPNAIQDAFSVMHLPTPEGEYAQCVNKFGASAPECAPAIAACTPSICGEYGSCTPQNGATPAFCTCVPGRHGSHCQLDDNECTPTSCGADQLHGGCWNYPGGYFCSCATGYERTDPNTPTETCGIVSCPAPDVSVNGTVTTTPGLTWQSVATYACNGGFTISSSLTRTCQADKTWSGEAPTCDAIAAYCPTQPTVANTSSTTVSGGAAGGSTTSVGATAAYTCSTGYTKSGMDATCLADASWSTPPTCPADPNWCPAPVVIANAPAPTVVNGIAGPGTNSFQANSQYTCNLGYQRQGSNGVCRADRTWSGAPTCIMKDCGTPPTVTNAGVPSVSGGIGGGSTTTYNAQAVYTCNTGYAKTGGNPKCLATGLWGTAPTCNMVTCAAPAVVANAGTPTVSGGLGGGSTTTYGAVADYTCNAGFAQSGGDPTCQQSGTWTTTPTCNAIASYCPAAPTVTNAGAAIISGGAGGGTTTSVGATAAYTCNTGYTKSGSNPTCQANATWSAAPTCTMTNCGAAPTVANAGSAIVSGGFGGGTTTTYGATAAYACNAGFAKSGSDATCQANGTWSAAPACTAVAMFCPAAPTVTNASAAVVSGGAGGGTTTSVGATAAYTCNTGYAKSGSDPTCQTNATWSAAPTCTVVASFCPTAPSVTNAGAATVSGGVAGGTTTSYQATAAYTCSTGYTKSGSNATCQASATWSAAPTCTMTNCGTAPTVTNAGAASVSGGLGGTTTTTYGATAAYACNTGYTKSGSDSTCQANGSWSAAPTCTITNCGPAPTVPNGGAAMVSGGLGGGSTTTYGASASYSCNTGYATSGSIALCQANGTWSAPPVCTATISYCPAAPSVTNAGAATVSGGVAGGTSTSYQATAAYTCNSGYAKSGSDSVCQANATWSTAPVCADINECMTGNGGCNANALCTNTAGSRTCACNPGYTGDGFTCTIVSCGSLTAPTNGTVSTPGGVTYGQVATYGCNAGYLLTELPTRTCDAAGAWSGTAPLCVTNADQAWVRVTNATSSHTVATTDRYLSHGSSVTVTYRGTGQYAVTLSSMAGGPTSRPVVVVTSTSATSARCQVLSQATNAGTSNLKVEVRCVQPTTAAYVDSTFNLMVWHTFGATSSTLGGYLLTPSANPGTSALVNADATNSYDWTGATVQWQRTGTGTYYVSMPGTTGVDCSGGTPSPKPPVTFVASSYGGGLGDVCVVSGYFSGAGTGVGAYVNCYGANGAAKDARFALMAPPYSSATPGTAYTALTSAGVVSTCVTTNTALGTRTTNLASHASTGNYVLESRAFAVNGMAFAAANAITTPAYCNPSTVTTATTWCSGTRPITTTTVNCYSLAGAAIDSAFSIIERGTIQTCP